MENINLNNLSLEQLTALKRKVEAAWDSRYESAIKEVNTVKLANGDFQYTYGEKSYLATKLPNGKIRLFHTEASKRTATGYKRGEVAKSEISEGFYGIRHLIRFNQIATA
jgi:hypothetical protein